MDKEKVDMISHPPHYNASDAYCACGRQIECIDVTRNMNFNIGNAVKYLWRYKHKGADTDLKKAIWYIEDYIKHQYPVDALLWGNEIKVIFDQTMMWASDSGWDWDTYHNHKTTAKGKNGNYEIGAQRKWDHKLVWYLYRDTDGMWTTTPLETEIEAKKLAEEWNKEKLDV